MVSPFIHIFVIMSVKATFFLGVILERSTLKFSASPGVGEDFERPRIR